MFDNPRFYKSVFSLKELPEENLPAVILCGRSNVGKSSLINSLFRKKNLAKTSSTPGKTRSINYYNIGEKFFIVDLPGYGYAKTSQKEREYWGRLMNDYFSSVKNISLALHIVDSRIGPTELDMHLNSFLSRLSIRYIIILSKSDKLKKSEEMVSAERVIRKIPGLKLNQNLLFYSASKGTGRNEILHLLSELFY
jgi:GTP-binding protein